MGIFTYADVVAHLPRRYESFALTSNEEARRMRDKQKVVLFGRILQAPRFQRFGKTSLVRFVFRSSSDRRDYEIEAWNRPYLMQNVSLEEDYTLKGSYDAKGHCLNLIALKKGAIPAEGQMVPVYTLPADYPEYAWRKLVEKALKEESGMAEIVPAPLREKYRLLPRIEAFRRAHFPKNAEDVHQGLRVLKYEEALLFSLRNQWIRAENKVVGPSGRKPIDISEVAAFVRSFPYPLTVDQKKAVREGLADLNAPTLMYRLLQGDVGTGKTLVAAVLLYANYLRGEQGALLAPTDALARQHADSLTRLFAPFSLRVGLLVGSLTAKEKAALTSKIRDGEIDVIVGTHALFSASVHYRQLGFVIIDEQHKFGVNQRRELAEKGEGADLLLMSATPIPRTLANSLYGDLDVSTLSVFPAKKREVETLIVAPKAKEIFRLTALSVGSGHRVFVVAPQIERKDGEDDVSAEEVFARFQGLFPGQTALLHGQMDQEEKDMAIASFKDGSKPILVATSVIEVGIDVPEADLIVLYSPTRFGLASLHQLRGRVGRNGDPAKCLLVFGGKAEEDLDKLNVLVRTNDGFEVAEEDLKRRGPGEIAGTRQSGIPEFHYVNLVEDFRMLECAREDAAEILEKRDDPQYAPIAEKTRRETESSALA